MNTQISVRKTGTATQVREYQTLKLMTITQLDKQVPKKVCKSNTYQPLYTCNNN